MIDAMGDKSNAKETMKRAGVPTIPGTEGLLSDLKEGLAIADEINYPVILKATAGGGGRGMRIVWKPEELEAAWDATHVTLEIRDHGPGISADVAARAGEAFFTTKGPGGGLGIGLFLANATIERFGGKVNLFNCEGGGACVRVTLPLQHKDA